MKSKKSEKYFMLSSAGLLLMIVFLYLLVPEFGISLNRSFEMMKSGSEKGLMMIFYQFDSLAFLFAAFTYALQLLTLLFHNDSVIAACYGLFEPLSAKLILTCGGSLAMLTAYGLSLGLTQLLMRFQLLAGLLSRWQTFHQKYEYFWAGMIGMIMTVLPGPQYALIYCLGFLKLDMRKILPAAIVMMLIFL